MEVLMVAEKPSLARTLAELLADHGTLHTRPSRVSSCPVHEFTAVVLGQRCKVHFTSVMGHVFSLDFPPKYNNWDATAPVELFDAPTEKKEAGRAALPEMLKQEAKHCTHLVLWLDADREGENICFEVMELTVPHLKGRPGEANVYRARFSAITATDVRHALAHLVRPNRNESLSVDARQELDLRMGCAFTRFQTRFFQGKYGDLDSSLLSFGPCQTPTLALCVARHDQIKTFKPEPYWTLDLQVQIGTSLFKAQWDRVRVFERDIASLFHKSIEDCKKARVTDCVSKEKAKPRPTAMNSVELMRTCSSGLAMGPQHAMRIAEQLYMQGYISYPRTETTAYSQHFDLEGTLRMIQDGSGWSQTVRELLQKGITRPKGGKDVGDHPPITPTRLAREGELSGDMWRLYDLVTRHFIASVSPDCRYMSTTVTLDVNGETFTLQGQRVIDPGFTSVMYWLGPNDDAALPTINVGDNLPIVSCTIGDRQTSPPGYLTESDLISLMEKHGIGTDASISVHINNICERRYVTIESGRTLVPTNLGIVMIHGYQKIDVDLCLPTMRAAVEQQLDLIAQGQAEFGDVLLHFIDLFRRKFVYFEQNVNQMDGLFEVTFTRLCDTGAFLSRCGKCNRYVKLVESTPQRLYCQTCDETYPLPQRGKITTYNDQRCPLDNFELVLYSTGSEGRTMPLCPYCFNNPPFEGMRKGEGCTSCLHPECPHSVVSNGICSCIECDSGVLVVDRTNRSKPRITCNTCTAVLQLPVKMVKKVRAQAEKTCDVCHAKLLSVDFHKDQSPLSDAAPKYTGCLFCDEKLNQLGVHFQHMQAMRRQGRGGGRGGGRGRGGRGRGREPVKLDKMTQLDRFFL